MLRSACGTTLIELVVTITIVSIAMITLITVTSQSSSRSVDPMIQEQAIAVAQAYMEEITQKGFCDPDLSSDCVTACSGASACSNAACTVVEGARNLFDDVCDYAGLADVGAYDQNGMAPLSGLEQYNVNVQIIDTGISLGPAGSLLNANNGEVVRIDVSVSHQAMSDAVQLTGYRSNF